MSSTKDFKEFILEQLHLARNISCRPMMGEFMLYSDGILFGGIYDNQLLIKKTQSALVYNLPETIPYKNAKPMLLIDNIDNPEFLADVINLTCQNLTKK